MPDQILAMLDNKVEGAGVIGAAIRGWSLDLSFFFENCVLVILLELRFQAESCVSGKEG
jgi:hypothetical protein